MQQPHPAQLPSVKQGYAAIISILVIMGVIVTVGMSVSVMSISNAQMSLGQSKGEEALSLANSCIEDALLTYNNLGTVPSSITLPSGNCTLNTISQTANNITFSTSVNVNNYQKTVTVQADRTTSVSVVNWIENN